MYCWRSLRMAEHAATALARPSPAMPTPPDMPNDPVPDDLACTAITSIQSFNDKKPFDQFTIEQMAGRTCLPNPTVEQLIATAFPPQYAHEQRRRHQPGGVSAMAAVCGPREHDDERLDGHVHGVRPSATRTSTIRFSQTEYFQFLRDSEQYG